MRQGDLKRMRQIEGQTDGQTSNKTNNCQIYIRILE